MKLGVRVIPRITQNDTTIPKPPRDSAAMPAYSLRDSAFGLVPVFYNII